MSVFSVEADPQTEIDERGIALETVDIDGVIYPVLLITQ